MQALNTKIFGQATVTPVSNGNGSGVAMDDTTLELDTNTLEINSEFIINLESIMKFKTPGAIPAGTSMLFQFSLKISNATTNFNNLMNSFNQNNIKKAIIVSPNGNSLMGTGISYFNAPANELIFRFNLLNTSATAISAGTSLSMFVQIAN